MNIRRSWMAACAALALCAGNAGADHSVVDPLEFGIKAGVNLASLKSSFVKDPDPVTGLIAGLFLSANFGAIAITPEVLFAAKGYSYSTAIGTTALTVVDRFNYIEVPVLLRWMVIPAGPVRPFLAAGPAVSFLMSAESKAELAGATTTTDVKSALKSHDFSAVVGGGVAISLGVATVSVEARYAIGLADITRDEGVSTRNSVFSVLAGLSF